MKPAYGWSGIGRISRCTRFEELGEPFELDIKSLQDDSALAGEIDDRLLRILRGALGVSRTDYHTVSDTPPIV